MFFFSKISYLISLGNCLFILILYIFVLDLKILYKYLTQGFFLFSLTSYFYTNVLTNHQFFPTVLETLNYKLF